MNSFVKLHGLNTEQNKVVPDFVGLVVNLKSLFTASNSLKVLLLGYVTIGNVGPCLLLSVVN